MDIKRRLVYVLLLLGGIALFGVVGYMVVEGWSFLDALYMTVISITTVGYNEVHPLSRAGRIFTIVLLFMGVGGFFYALGVLVEAFVEGHFTGILGQRRMAKAIEKLSRHYIVCGYGRIGRTISRVIAERGIPVVVVESDPAGISDIAQQQMPYIQGDATADDILIRAGVQRAKGVICVLQSDADNVYITLTARSLNPGLMIIARASDPRSEKKMVQAGADRVISPYEIGARRMALAVIQPTVTEFLDLAVHSTGFNLAIEQVEIGRGCALDGVSLMDAGLRQKAGVSILAVQQPSAEMVMAPDADYVLRHGDIVVVLGDRKGFQILKTLTMANDADDGVQ